MVNSLEEKSIQSIESAKLLIKQPFYASTVNRAYYSCINIFFHILFSKLGRNNDDFNIERKSINKGSHEYASLLILDEVRKESYKDFKWLQEHIKILKQWRVDADYTDKVITQEIASLSISKAESITNTVKRNLL